MFVGKVSIEKNLKENTEDISGTVTLEFDCGCGRTNNPVVDVNSHMDTFTKHYCRLCGKEYHITRKISSSGEEKAYCYLDIKKYVGGFYILKDDK